MQRLGHSSLAGRLAAVAVALCAGGCSVLGSGGSGPPPTYDLTAAQQFSQGVRNSRGQLIVPDATATGPLDSDRIIVRPAEGEIAALADAQWSERLTRLVQVRMIQSFENARKLRAVGRPSDRIVGDYQLLLDIRAFDILAAGPAAEVVIAAKIVGDRSGRAVATKVFSARVPATATRGAPAVAALDEAWNQVAAEIVQWAARII